MSRQFIAKQSLIAQAAAWDRLWRLLLTQPEQPPVQKEAADGDTPAADKAKENPHHEHL